MRTKLWLMLVGLLVVPACQNSTREPDAGAPLQRFLEDAVAQGIPGISTAVATSDGIAWTGVAGSADVETGTPVRPDTIFGIGSITKTFVAVVILQLAEEGQVSLRATPADILGTSVRDIPNADKATIAQLLNHTGGVPSWEDDPVWIRDGRGDKLDVHRMWLKTATLPYIEKHAALGAPGEKFSYSNTAFTLLGMIIENVTGEDVMRVIHRRVLDPIALKDTYLEGFETVPEGRLPHRYHWATPDFRRDAGINAAFTGVRPGLIDATSSNLSVEWTAGGMVTTARDLALYGVALRDGRLLSPQSMKFMTDWFPAGEMGLVGHNLFRRELPGGGAIIGHSGDVLGFTATLYWVEGHDAVMAVLCNVGSMHAGTVPASAKSIGRSKEFVDLATRVAASRRGSRRVRAE